jgi:peptidoglycan/LPS O-acetylase OafA/YrhL
MHSPKTEAIEKLGTPVSHYRPDIDGLRAIAVVSVVIYHAFPGVLRSGFVGVDIFFVISGFLITSIILNGLDGDRFSFATFYARRIRRIFPALLIVLAASMVAGWFFLLPDEYRLFGKHVVAGAGFVSNFELWREAGYFDPAGDTKILLHLWSLGVEEQYYLVWPAVLWAAWRSRLNLFTLFLGAFLCSFAYSVVATKSNTVVAFYSPLARFWELGAGGFLSLVLFRPPPLVALFERKFGAFLHAAVFETNSGEAISSNDTNSTYRGFLSILGLALILTSTIIITRRQEFPGWWALLPTAGAYFTLLAGPSAWLNRTVLSNRVMVWLGLISYPLYLWHWPLLAFARDIWGNTPPREVRIGLVLAAVVLAWLTYVVVERPVRFGKPKRWIVAILCGCMVALAAAGSVIFFTDGIRSRWKDRDDYAAYFDAYLYDASKHVEERQQIAQNQCNFYSWDAKWPTNGPRESIDAGCYTKHSQKSVLILGDSNAADLYYGLNEALPKDVSTLLIFSSGCPVRPLNDAQIQEDHCNMTNHFALERIKQDPPDVVLMSSNSSFDIDYIRTYSEMITKLGVKHIFVLGQRPHWKPYLYKIIIKDYWYSTPRYVPGHQDDELLAFGNRFKAQLRPNEPFEYVDEIEPFCNSEGCLTYLGDNRRDGLITFDDAHLRPFASVYLAEKQLVPLILPHLSK